MSITNRFIRASFWAAGTTYLFFAINFIGQIVMARLLVPKYFGLFAFVFAIREVISIFMGFSVSQAFIYSDGGQHDFNACISLALVTLGAFTLLGILLFVPMVDFYGYQYGAMLVILCFSQGVLNLANNYLAPLEKALNYKRSSLLRGLASSGSVFIAIMAAYSTRSIWSLGLRELLQAVILLVLAMKLGGFSFRLRSFTLKLKSKFHFGVKTAIANGMAIVYYRFADLFIHALFGQLLLGYFYQARYLSYLPIKLLKPFTQDVVFSYLTHYRHDIKALGQQIYWLNYAAIRLMFPVVFVVYFFGADIFHLIYGAKWQSAGVLFSYSAILIMFSILYANLQDACYSVGKQVYATQGYLLALLFFAGLTLLFPSIAHAMMFFSLGFAFGYFYMVIRLLIHGVKFDVFSLFLLPLLIAIIINLLNHLLANRFWLTTSFIFLYLAMLFIEQDKVRALIKVSWKAVRKHD